MQTTSKKTKATKDYVIRARAEASYEADILRAASITGLDGADIIRMGVREKCAQIFSRANGLAMNYGQTA